MKNLFKYFGVVAIAAIAGVNCYMAADVYSSDLSLNLLYTANSAEAEDDDGTLWDDIKECVGDLCDKLDEKDVLWEEARKECTVTESSGITGVGAFGFSISWGGDSSSYPGHYTACDDGDDFCWSTDCEKD